MVTTGSTVDTKTAKHSSKKRRIILIIAGVVVVGLGAYVAWSYIAEKKENIPLEERPLTKQEKLNNELIDSVVGGEKEDSDAALESALAAATSDEDRAELYLDRASYLYYVDGVTEQMKKQALADAEKSYSLHASIGAAKTILDIAGDLGRVDLTKKYQPIFDAYMKDVEDLSKKAQE